MENTKIIIDKSKIADNLNTKHIEQILSRDKQEKMKKKVIHVINRNIQNGYYISVISIRELISALKSERFYWLDYTVDFQLDEKNNEQMYIIKLIVYSLAQQTNFEKNIFLTKNTGELKYEDLIETD